jgi:hypothetical protein
MAPSRERSPADPPFPGMEEQQSSTGRSVTVQLDGRTVSAEYSDLTGQLVLREDGAVVQEWYPPHSWVAIASAAGASNWGTRPSSEDLQALIRNEMLPAARRQGFR